MPCRAAAAWCWRRHRSCSISMPITTLGKLTITGSETAGADARYPIVAGNARLEERDHYNQLTDHSQEKGGKGEAQDGRGAALPMTTASRLPHRRASTITDGGGGDHPLQFSASTFRRPINAGASMSAEFGSSHEGEFDPACRACVTITCSIPRFACETGGPPSALTEPDLLDFAGMYLTGRGDGGPGCRSSSRLRSTIIGSPCTRISLAIVTPWRVVMLADQLEASSTGAGPQPLQPGGSSCALD